ncbi:MAG: hypothetical protein A2Y17_07665 [Clostridiales bacterium GWF2_38_85]|nr:MAG: hypothetical protein A2Y17_07665 [Clostridiales bacterium GWF2_38_85]
MKKLYLLLVIIIILSLASCNGGNNNSTTSESESSGINSTASEEESLFVNLPEYNGNGEEFWFLVGGKEYGERYKSIEIAADENTTELINDAVLNRNNLVEEKLDIKICTYATASGESIAAKIRNLIQSNDDTYDVVMPMMTDAATLAVSGSFYALNDIETLDLTAKWWDEKTVEELTLANNLYFTTGYMSILDNDNTQCLIFNKTLLQENGLESPYQLVNDGEWTIDRLQEMAATVTKDTNGDSLYNSDDIWGIYINTFAPQFFYIASGERFIIKDLNDLPQIAVNTTRAYSVVDRLAELMGDTTACYQIENIPAAEYQGKGFSDYYYLATDAIGTNRCLFRTMCLVDIRELADYNCSYGIIPLPKFDKNQDEYYSIVDVTLAPGICIPTTNQNPELAGIVLSAMGEASEKTLNYAYYDVMLKQRKVEDTESRDMLDIIFNNRVYDLSIAFNWGGLSSIIDVSVKDGQNTFQSTLDANLDKIQTAIDSTINSLK